MAGRPAGLRCRRHGGDRAGAPAEPGRPPSRGGQAVQRAESRRCVVHLYSRINRWWITASIRDDAVPTDGEPEAGWQAGSQAGRRAGRRLLHPQLPPRRRRWRRRQDGFLLMDVNSRDKLCSVFVYRRPAHLSLSVFASFFLLFFSQIVLSDWCSPRR